MKNIFGKLTPIVAILLMAVMFVTACAAEETRIRTPVVYNPGASFSSNFKVVTDGIPDARRQIKCSIVFEVLDEQAVEELTEYNFKVRNSVLTVLGELTLEEVTIDKDLRKIAERIVERVNEDLNLGDITLVLRAYFTEFIVQ